jgi:hypothetical protein
MNSLYVTYKVNGQLRRGVISQQQYTRYQQDASITDLQIHASQVLMEEYYNNVTGNPNKPKKQLLYS